MSAPDLRLSPPVWLWQLILGSDLRLLMRSPSLVEVEHDELGRERMGLDPIV